MKLNYIKSLFPKQLRKKVKNHLYVPSLSWSLINLRKIGFNPKNVLDIGAYHGEWTLEFLEIFPNCNILMIEAQSNKVKLLGELTRNYPNTRCFEALISAKDGEKIDFFENETASFASYNKMQGGIEKETRTIDSILRETNFSPPNFIKIDIQGFELEALKGAELALTTTEFCLLEVTVLNIGGPEPEFLDVLKFMDERNFQLYDISQIMRRPYDYAIFQMDVLFVKKDSIVIEKKVW